MPDVIISTFASSPVVLQWYLWGVVLSSVFGAAVAVWVFNDARRAGNDATMWKTFGLVAAAFGSPALLARLHAGLATEMRSSLLLLAYLSMGACVASIAVAIGYIATRRRSASGAASWAVDDLEVSQPQRGSRHAEPEPAAAEHETVVLKAAEPPKPLAFLAITSGPYAETMLPLHAGTNRIGRDGTLNDHPVDDAAVSAQHLSVRFRDGEFVATDLDSANGTFVNGRRVEKHALSPNDVLQIGTTRLVFLLVPSGRAVAS